MGHFVAEQKVIITLQILNMVNTFKMYLFYMKMTISESNVFKIRLKFHLIYCLPWKNL